MLHLRQTLHRTLRKCCACREAAPDLAKVLRLPRNLCRTLRKKSAPDLAKVLRLPRNVCVECLQSLTHPLLNHHFLEHHGGGGSPPLR